MGKLIKPQVNRIYEQKVKQVTQDLSARSTVIVVTVTSVLCPNCIYDAVNKASSGKYQDGGPQPFSGRTCPVCKNKGKIDTETRREIKCNVRWGRIPQTAPVLLPEGKMPQDMASLKTDISNRSLVDNATFFVVDGIRCTIYGVPKPTGLLRYIQIKFTVWIDK